MTTYTGLCAVIDGNYYVPAPNHVHNCVAAEGHDLDVRFYEGTLLAAGMNEIGMIEWVPA